MITGDGYVCTYGGYDVLVEYRKTLSTECEENRLTVEMQRSMLELIENLNKHTFYDVFNGENPLRMSVNRFLRCMMNYEGDTTGVGIIMISSIQDVGDGHEYIHHPDDSSDSDTASNSSEGDTLPPPGLNEELLEYSDSSISCNLDEK